MTDTLIAFELNGVEIEILLRRSKMIAIKVGGHPVIGAVSWLGDEKVYIEISQPVPIRFVINDPWGDTHWFAYETTPPYDTLPIGVGIVRHPSSSDTL